MLAKLSAMAFPTSSPFNLTAQQQVRRQETEGLLPLHNAVDVCPEDAQEDLPVYSTIHRYSNFPPSCSDLSLDVRTSSTLTD